MYFLVRCSVSEYAVLYEKARTLYCSVSRLEVNESEALSQIRKQGAWESGRISGQNYVTQFGILVSDDFL